MFGGVALYLAGHLGFRMRNVGSINPPRAVAVVVLLLAPLGLQFVPALAALAVLALLLVVLVVFEVRHYAEARAKVRAQATAHH
jgi:ABC-type proline/glycine betaine transport system permease subunit